MPVSAYDIGGNYKEQVLGAHHALTRAGYPAHIVHERLHSPRQSRDLHGQGGDLSGQGCQLGRRVLLGFGQRCHAGFGALLGFGQCRFGCPIRGHRLCRQVPPAGARGRSMGPCRRRDHALH